MPISQLHVVNKKCSIRKCAQCNVSLTPASVAVPTATEDHFSLYCNPHSLIFYFEKHSQKTVCVSICPPLET